LDKNYHIIKARIIAMSLFLKGFKLKPKTIPHSKIHNPHAFNLPSDNTGDILLQTNVSLRLLSSG